MICVIQVNHGNNLLQATSQNRPIEMNKTRQWAMLFFAPQGLLMMYFAWTLVFPPTYLTSNGISFTYRKTSSSITILKATESATGDLTIPDKISQKKVTSIRKHAFSNCRRLTSVTFPATLKKIGQGAFAGCTNLVSLTFQGDAPSTHPFLTLAKEAKAHIIPNATGFGNTFGGIPVIITPSPTKP
jgi:hypothetical protein